MDKVVLIGRDEVPGQIRLAAGKSLRLTLIALPGTSEDVSMEVDIDGEGCEVDIAGLYLCRADERLSVNVLVRHNSGGSISRQNFKGIAGGNSRAVFDGLIYVATGAQKTKAYQENHTILLSDTAKVESRPQLEIYADDVECSHGCTSGFLNMEEQFYMRSRGIPEDEAKHLQMVAFLAPIVSRLPEDLASQVYDSIS